MQNEQLFAELFTPVVWKEDASVSNELNKKLEEIRSMAKHNCTFTVIVKNSLVHTIIQNNQDKLGIFVSDVHSTTHSNCLVFDVAKSEEYLIEARD